MCYSSDDPSLHEYGYMHTVHHCCSRDHLNLSPDQSES